MTITTTKLTREQLITRAREYQALADWMIVRDFCNQVYGEGKVQTLTVETEGQYNDEGGTNYYIESLTAKDVSGKELAFDLSLPFWQLETVQEYMRDTGIEEEDEEDIGIESELIGVLKEICWSRDDPNKGKWVDFDDLPCLEDWPTYDLSQEPLLSSFSGEE